LACLAVQLFETHVLGLVRHQRLVRDASEFAVRIAGISHFIVALFFLLTSTRGRGAPIRLAGLTLLGSGISLGFWWAGGITNPICFAGFYVLFMAHALRDEGFFHQQQMTCPRTLASRLTCRGLHTMAAAVLGMIVVPGWVYVTFLRGDP